MLLAVAQGADALLQEHCVVVNRFVLLVPADVAAALARSCLINAAHPVLGQELTGFEAFLDALLTLFGHLEDMPALEFGNRQVEMLCKPPDILSAHTHIASHPAAQAGALETVESWVNRHQGRRRRIRLIGR